MAGTSDYPHALHPFPGTSPGFPLGIRAQVSLGKDGKLRIAYRLEGKIEKVRLAARQALGGIAQAQRADRLWEHTCLEAFIGVAGSERYWEVNLSPSGDWNVYRFERCREEMAPETAIPEVPFRVVAEGSTESAWEAEIDLGAIRGLREALGSGAGLELGLTAVIEAQDGEKSYWALAHAGGKPDFHLRKSFVLKIVKGAVQ